MKKVILLLLVSAFALNASAQMEEKSAAQINKERKATMKMSREELNKKATKDARKEAKDLEKAGWKTTPGGLPVEKQLDRSYLMQYEYEESGYPTYIFGEAMSIGQTYDGAKIQALELAKLNLVSQIQSEISALVDNTVANNQIGAGEAATVVESVMASKSLISQNIGRTVSVVELYRVLPNKNTEVLVRISYSGEMARKAAINAIRKDLEAKGNSLHKDLDKLIK